VAALRGLGNVAVARGEVAAVDLRDTALADKEYAQAQDYLRQSIALATELGDEWGAAKAKAWYAITFRGDPGSATIYFEEAIASFRRLGDHRQLCLTLWTLGGVDRDLGNLVRASDALSESLRLAHQLGYRWHAGLCLLGIACVALDEGNAERSARLFAAAEMMRDKTGEPLRPVIQRMVDQAIRQVRTALGEVRFTAAWNSGADLSRDGAIAEALTRPTMQVTDRKPNSASTAIDALTPREMDVLRLIAAGRSDRAIADALFISRRTASNHVAAILAKLGVASRAEAAARAVREGMA
jgi:DNA-binding CsgD family transcriptional regulator